MELQPVAKVPAGDLSNPQALFQELSELRTAYNFMVDKVTELENRIDQLENP